MAARPGALARGDAPHGTVASQALARGQRPRLGGAGHGTADDVPPAPTRRPFLVCARNHAGAGSNDSHGAALSRGVAGTWWNAGVMGELLSAANRGRVRRRRSDG